MSWWWSGAIAAARRNSESSITASGNYSGVGLVIGATGIVGTSLVSILPLSDTPGGPWKVYAVSCSRPSPDLLCPMFDSPSVHHIGCDISDPSDALANLSPLIDVTHIFYAVWTERESESENIAVNTAMLRNVLAAVLPFAPNLQHVCLQTGGKHYTVPFESLGKVRSHEPPFHEGLPRLPFPNLYYAQEDALFETLKNHNASVTWSIHRPNTIFGYSPFSRMNIVSTLCVYASICKRERKPLRWPGNRESWEGFSDASDADLIAEQQIWATVDPLAKNEAFNITNGDIFRWKHLWGVLAQQFGLESVGFESEEGRFSLAVEMKGKDELWEEIVEENELAPTKLNQVGHWWFADVILNAIDGMDSMNKSKEHGFFGFRNTLTSFVTWIERMKSCKIVP